ncbi:MAG TPA: DUF1634 domain-containing protein [Bryobacteraceae bacterium]|nr:DUF1634 domain-containing protein [Bryobacteraceae bacterium]
MSSAKPAISRFERLLAQLLRYGTWLASGVIALGLALLLSGALTEPGRFGFSSTNIITAGIAAFILLPVLRVIVMLAVFTRKRDYLFIAITFVVLAILLTGFAIGRHVA